MAITSQSFHQAAGTAVAVEVPQEYYDNGLIPPEEDSRAVAVVVPQEYYDNGLISPEQGSRSLLQLHGRVELGTSQSPSKAKNPKSPFNFGSVQLIAIIAAIAVTVLSFIAAGVFLIATGISIPVGVTLITVPIIVAIAAIKCIFFRR